MTTKTQTLLIIDDEPEILKGLKIIFSELVNTVYTAENGLEGLKVIDTHQISCIISDIKMPILEDVFGGGIRPLKERVIRKFINKLINKIRIVTCKTNYVNIIWISF
jgi:CheY-like chemotaxis protein